MRYATQNPFALNTLNRHGHDTAFPHTKHVSRFQHPGAPATDFVFTVCDSAASEDCPPWPGQQITGHWGVPDPAKAAGTDAEKAQVFAQTYSALRQRIESFVALPLESLSRVSRQSRVDAIGTDAQMVLLNDSAGDGDQHALLMEFDSVHGRWDKTVGHQDGALELNRQSVRLSHEKKIEALPLAELGIDLVIDCTGVFNTSARIAPCFAAGVRKLVVSAPVRDGGALNLVCGVNHHLFDGSQSIITAASCTTNCLAPVVKVIHESLGIRHGSITTIHDVTNTQTIADRPAKEMRHARSALMNLIPASTGNATNLAAG